MKLQMEQVASYLAQQLQADVQVLQLRRLGSRGGQLAPTFFFGDMEHQPESDALKTFSYGNPILVDCLVDHCYKRFVLRTVAANQFDHQRRSDRAEEILLGYETYNTLPRHARALDVGIVTKEHGLASIAQGEEHFLLTEYVKGKPYVSDLQRLCDSGEVTGADLMRTRQLALYLANVHCVQGDDATLYTRHIRETLFGGEGIMGLIDSYMQSDGSSTKMSEADASANQLRHANGHTDMAKRKRSPNVVDPFGRATSACNEQLANGIQTTKFNKKRSTLKNTPGEANWFEEMEKQCVTWRWRLRGKEDRLAQIHGDFHPYNVLFEHNGTFHTIGRSRGAWGEPADDVAAMTINYLFFSLQRSGTLTTPFEQLWNIFWNTYCEMRHDSEIFTIIGPFFAWRALVLASPVWYQVSDTVRTKLLTFAGHALQEPLFNPAAVNDYFIA